MLRRISLLCLKSDFVKRATYKIEGSKRVYRLYIAINTIRKGEKEMEREKQGEVSSGRGRPPLQAAFLWNIQGRP